MEINLLQVNISGGKYMKAYCPYCRKENEYRVEKREVKEFRGIEVNM